MVRTASLLASGPDWLIAAGLLALGLLEAIVVADAAPIWGQVPLTFAWTVPLIWRRRWPVLVLAIVIPMGPAIELVNKQGGVTSFVLSAVVASYTVGRRLDAPQTWWGPALTVGFGWTWFIATAGELSDFVFIALLYGGAWAVGHAIRRRDLQVDELARQTEELQRAHAERERRAVEQERVRIARDLHDIVSHSISVITIQAQAVRHRLDAASSSEVEALRVIETTARQALAEMRRLVGILRSQDDPAALAPQPSLDQLPALVEEARRSGIEVRLNLEGTPPMPISPGMGLTVYRVVQEALTNVRKHSLADVADVTLRYRPDALELQVDDSGPARVATSPSDSLLTGGHGLAGMRERVALYNGRLVTSARPEGGFRLQVTLPLSGFPLTSSPLTTL